MTKEILIGDPDKANQKEFQKIFGATDYHLVFSESGEDVLLRVKLFRPDLIIAGTTLGEKNGYEVCEAIKEDPNFRSIPFILLLNMFEELSDKDRDRLKADAILSKPLHRDEVLALVNQLLEGLPGKKMELETFHDTGEEGLSLIGTEGEGEEEEIIDLVDVVEEAAEDAESKVSIEDFVLSEKAEPFGEVTSPESWGKLVEEEKPAAEEGLSLSVEEEEPKVQDFPYTLKQDTLPPKESEEEELFEKIELEDILEKVGKMERPSEGEAALRAGADRATRAQPSQTPEIEEKPFAFEEFEMALKKGVEVEGPKKESLEEEALQPLTLEELREEVRAETTPTGIQIEDKVESLEEEEFPKDLLEDMLKEEGLPERGLEGEELEEETLTEEGLLEEELQKETFVKEEELFEEEGLPEEEMLEEEKPLEEETLKIVEGIREEEKVELFEGIEAPKVPEREQGLTFEAPGRLDEAFGAMEEASRMGQVSAPPPSRGMEKEVQEVISEKIQAMMAEFVSKHVPEMAKDIVQLTVERIEKMVREIVPDLAEKMIEEEIKRLEKGETE